MMTRVLATVALAACAAQGALGSVVRSTQDIFVPQVLDPQVQVIRGKRPARIWVGTLEVVLPAGTAPSPLAGGLVVCFSGKVKSQRQEHRRNMDGVATELRQDVQV